VLVHQHHRARDLPRHPPCPNAPFALGSALSLTALPFTALALTALNFTALALTALPFTALALTALPFTALALAALSLATAWPDTRFRV